MQKTYSQLLTDVQKKAKITVSKSRDLRFLKEDIDENTGTGIGYNTLRRLFGFLEKAEPSSNTLNILARYLGFKSFSNYKNDLLNYDGWYFQQNLLRIQASNKITKEDLELIRYGLLNNDNTIYFAYFFSFFVERNNLDALEKIVREISYDNIFESNGLKFATIVSLSLYRIEEKKALNIYSKLVKYDNFRYNVPLLYIDYSNLKKKYGKILTIIRQQSKREDDILFVDLMRFYWKFYSSKKYMHIEIKKPENFENFHPVLKGRFHAYLLLNSEKRSPELERKIIKFCKTVTKAKASYEISFFLEEIIPALIFKKNFTFLDELVDSFYEDILEMDTWASKTGHALSLIAMANLNIEKKNLTMAQINLNLVELEKVELSYSDYVALFYYQTKLHISYLNNVEEKNLRARVSLEKLIQKTGFTKFKQTLEEFSLLSSLKE